MIRVRRASGDFNDLILLVFLIISIVIILRFIYGSVGVNDSNNEIDPIETGSDLIDNIDINAEHYIIKDMDHDCVSEEEIEILNREILNFFCLCFSCRTRPSIGASRDTISMVDWPFQSGAISLSHLSHLCHSPGVML